jgi:hypothetical protein
LLRIVEEICRQLEIRQTILKGKEEIIREEKYSWNTNYMDSLGVLSDCMARILADRHTSVVAIYLEVKQIEAKYLLNRIRLVKKNDGNDDTIKTNIKNLLKFCIQSESNDNNANDIFLTKENRNKFIQKLRSIAIEENKVNEKEKEMKKEMGKCLRKRISYPLNDEDFLKEIDNFFEKILNNQIIQNLTPEQKKNSARI